MNCPSKRQCQLINDKSRRYNDNRSCYLSSQLIQRSQLEYIIQHACDDHDACADNDGIHVCMHRLQIDKASSNPMKMDKPPILALLHVCILRCPSGTSTAPNI